MTELWIAHGICSPIRPKLLTALEPYGVVFAAECWAQNEDGTNRHSDGDSMAPLHVARIAVNPQAAVWAEYLLCRYMAANPGVGMRLMGKALDKRNARWAARWDAMPKAWRQAGCRAVAPTGPAASVKPPRKSAGPSRGSRSLPGRSQPQPRGGILARLFRRR